MTQLELMSSYKEIKLDDPHQHTYGLLFTFHIPLTYHWLYALRFPS